MVQLPARRVVRRDRQDRVPQGGGKKRFRVAVVRRPFQPVVRAAIRFLEIHAAHTRQVLVCRHQIVKAGFVSFQPQHGATSVLYHSRIRLAYFLRIRFFLVWR